MNEALRTASDSDALVEVDEAPRPEVLLPPRFALLRVFKQDGPVETFLARDEQGGHLVIVKRLVLARARDWKRVELFEREARVLASLSHPSIPAFLHTGVFEQPDGMLSLLLVQQYVEGRTLEEFVQGQVADETFARHIARDVLDVLAYLQARRPPIVHRDIKPSNLIVRPDGGISVIDFGALQSVARSDQTVGSTIVGTPGFVAPEQMMGRAIPASDMYGLGATLVQVVSGVHPSDLPSTGMRIDFEDSVNVSPGFARFLARLIAPSVDGRFSRATEALAALSNLTSTTQPAPVLEVQEPRMGWALTPRRSRLILAVVGAVSILSLAALWMAGVYEMRTAETRLRVGAQTSEGEVALPHARVFVDDELVCSGVPCDVSAVEPGYHRVRVEIPGRASQRRDITVARGTRPSVVVSF